MFFRKLSSKSNSCSSITISKRMNSNKTSFNYSDYLFIKQRNNRWISQLDALMKGQSCFIVLNAAYLGGDEGLLQLLRKEGFRVKRVN